MVLYVVLAYLVLFAALADAVCLNNASSFFHRFVQVLFVFMLCLCLFHFFNLHHAQCF